MNETTEIIYIPQSDGTITEFTVGKRVIDVEALEAQRDELLAIKESQKPSDSELIEWAKAFHPAYLIYDSQINELSNLILELKQCQ